MYAPSFDAESAAAIAAEHFGVHGGARQLPSERDQNFLITNSAGEKFVLKIANALEERALLDAQNAVLKHLERRISFCQRLVLAVSGEEMVSVRAPNEATHLVRLVHYLPGVPLAEIKPQPNELLRDLGRKLGELDRALVDFDHPAVHRDFHWDLANGNRILSEFGGLVKDSSLRELVSQCRFDIKRDLRTKCDSRRCERLQRARRSGTHEGCRTDRLRRHGLQLHCRKSRGRACLRRAR